MALVSYDYSGSEDEEENQENITSSVVIPPQKEVAQNGHKPSNTENNIDDAPSNPLFSSLPTTATKQLQQQKVVEDEIEDFIPKSKPTKVKEKVKITIPSLSEFDENDEDEPRAKKTKQPSAKGSGLLGILPPVRGAPLTNTTFVPKTVSNKTKKPASATSMVPNSVKKKAEAKRNEVLRKIQKKQEKASSDAESDDDIEIPDTFDDEMWEKVCGKPKPKKVIEEKPEEILPEIVNIAPEPEKPYDGLDNQAFKELVGKTKRPVGNIKLIDINEEEILPEKDIWMAKSLTDPEMAPKETVENPVDPTRRKKHHITYLAQQAKANEQELKSAWATSKNNRLMSRAKYGF